VYGRHEAASELAAMDPEHGMREEVFAKFGDEKGLAIMIKPFQVAKRDLGHLAGTDFSGSS
jgi:hypothetical protein